MYKDPFTEHQLRFYRSMPLHMRPGMLEPRKRRPRKITVEQVLTAALIVGPLVGFFIGYYVRW